MAKKPESGSAAQRAAAIRKQQASKERNRNLAVIGAIVAVMAIFVGVMVYLTANSGDPEKASDTAGGTPANSTDFGLKVGEDSAPTKVVLYEDFLCPICGQLEKDAGDRLTKLIDQGKFQVTYKPFNLLGNNPQLDTEYPQQATNAFAAVLDTAGPEAAMKFHKLLFDNQPTETGPYPDSDWFVEQAVKAGAKKSEVEGPIKDMEFEGWVAEATEDASKNKVNGTPTVFINGKQGSGGDLVKKIMEVEGQGSTGADKGTEGSQGADSKK